MGNEKGSSGVSNAKKCVHHRQNVVPFLFSLLFFFYLFATIAVNSGYRVLQVNVLSIVKPASTQWCYLLDRHRATNPRPSTSQPPTGSLAADRE